MSMISRHAVLSHIIKHHSFPTNTTNLKKFTNFLKFHADKITSLSRGHCAFKLVQNIRKTWLFCPTIFIVESCYFPIITNVEITKNIYRKNIIEYHIPYAVPFP